MRSQAGAGRLAAAASLALDVEQRGGAVLGQARVDAGGGDTGRAALRLAPLAALGEAIGATDWCWRCQDLVAALPAGPATFGTAAALLRAELDRVIYTLCEQARDRRAASSRGRGAGGAHGSTGRAGGHELRRKMHSVSLMAVLSDVDHAGQFVNHRSTCGHPTESMPRRRRTAGVPVMKVNLPVSQRELKIPADATLLSTTDTQSRITYANGAFIQVSGFQREELMGQPHNLVRHPDMPPQAFADMWRTIQSGQPWTALVKNRRKDGDHYWVRANATAVRRAGELVGYMSVRTKAADDEIPAAEALYAAFRDGRAKGLAIDRGLVVRTGWLRWRSAFKLMPLTPRVALGLGLALAPVVATALALGAAGSNVPPSLALPVAALAGFGLASGYFQAQLIGPLRATLRQALAVSSGQSIEPVLLERVDEIGMLMRAVNQAGLNLRALVDDVSAQVGGVEIASGEIAAGSQDLSARTEQAASSVQETAAAMEQLTHTIQQNSDSAREVSQLSLQAKAVAQQGGVAMQGVIEQMREISHSSQKIADIVGLIDSISFQTNILALNAAVEAARAGEQGRGFAVVASEVRALAHRSAQAAKEIKVLIDASVATIQSGGERVAQAGQTTEQVVTQVDRVSALIAEITSVSTEQASGVAQANQAVSSMDETTQHNAALVEQTAAAAESLRHQATRLAEAIGVYRGR